MSNPTTYVFPQERFDSMAANAASFDIRAPRTGDLRLDGSPIEFTGPHFRRDAAETAYLIRQLEDIRPGIDDMEFPELHAQEWFPWFTQIDEGAESFTTRQGSEGGKPEYTKDLKGRAPRVDMNLSEVSYKMHSFWLSYGYGVSDVRHAMKASIPLETRYAAMCREMLQRGLDDIAFLGASTNGVDRMEGTGLKGAFTLTGTDTYTVPLTGAGGLGTFESKDSDQVLLDLATPAQQVRTNTKGIENPESMIMPLSTFQYLNSRRVGDGTNEMILQVFRRDAYIKNIYATHKAETAGTGGAKLIMVYQKSAAKIEFLCPIPFKQYLPGTSENGLEVVTVCEVRTGGMVAHRPKSIIFASGV